MRTPSSTQSLPKETSSRPEGEGRRYVRSRCGGKTLGEVMTLLEAEGWHWKLSSFTRGGERCYRARVHRCGGQVMGRRVQAATAQDALEKAWVSGLHAQAQKGAQ